MVGSQRKEKDVGSEILLGSKIKTDRSLAWFPLSSAAVIHLMSPPSPPTLRATVCHHASDSSYTPLLDVSLKSPSFLPESIINLLLATHVNEALKKDLTRCRQEEGSMHLCFCLFVFAFYLFFCRFWWGLVGGNHWLYRKTVPSKCDVTYRQWLTSDSNQIKSVQLSIFNETNWHTIN